MQDVHGFDFSPNPAVPMNDFIDYLARREGEPFTPSGPKSRTRYIYLARDYESVSNPKRPLLAGAVYSPSHQRVRSRGVHDANKKLLRVEVDELGPDETAGDTSFFLMDLTPGVRKGLYLHGERVIGVQGLVLLLRHAFAQIKKARQQQALAEPGADTTAINRRFKEGWGGSVLVNSRAWRSQIDEMDQADQVHIVVNVPLPGMSFGIEDETKSFTLDYKLEPGTSAREARKAVEAFLRQLPVALRRQNREPPDGPSIADLLQAAKASLWVRGRKNGEPKRVDVRRMEQVVSFAKITPTDLDDLIRTTQWGNLKTSRAFPYLEHVMNRSTQFDR